MSLFSSSAMSAQQQKFAGRVLLTHSNRTLRWPAVLGAATLLGFVAALFIPVSSAVTATGTLVPSGGRFAVAALRSGTITAQFVAVGTKIRKGEPLVVVSSDVATSSDAAMLASVVGRTKERIDSLQKQQALELELQLLDRNDIAAKRLLKREAVHRYDLQLLSSSERVELRKKALDRYKRLEGFFSDAQIEQQSESLLQQEEAHTALQRQRDEAMSEALALGRALRVNPLLAGQKKEALARELAEARAELAEIEARREIVVRAPAAGHIASVQRGLGQPVGADSIILTILPDHGELVAEIELPGHAVGQVRTGAHALVRLEAFPYERYGEVVAEITSISSEPQTSTTAVAPSRRFLAAARIARQEMVVDGSPRPFMSGMRFVAVIRPDRRPLWQWLVQPLRREHTQ